ncbi:MULTISPECIES: ribonuclease HII [Flavobacterium]|uniref:Ribonuclease HII n=2 Tax=Flavobacterium TaxID=237 RepID=A0A437U7J5_9FLAO|nr:MULTISPECIES: ribonuclease HII [Flavobacterium]OWP83774.1 ribonuclease HII [Flavobacterium davisii]QYS88431.1 ribonuclease HII [Flavobacterium davisii]RVU89634.1 ribonuclease HII [Flavobacterium columnare]SPE76432.1 Ribonuclease HII [Flavobacterium columnare]
MLSLKFSNYATEVGCDEAGRGCLAGPVTAAAVILPEDFQIDSLNDSKQLSEKKRDALRPTIEISALSFAVTHLFSPEIDEINILNASMKAMQESILKLNIKPDFIIIDGNRPLLSKLGLKTQTGYNLSNDEINFLNSIPNKSIIKGDSKFMSIAAASILAKTYRDEYMNKIHEEFPMYNWNKNKGYPTKDHRAAIAQYGITKYHRRSFKLLPEQFVLDL